jgi:hypothetical protein
MKTRKTAQQQENTKQQITVQARLVKSNEMAAREAAREAAIAEVHAEAQAQAKAPVANPALKRTPRNATEARNMFEALFNRAA